MTLDAGGLRRAATALINADALEAYDREDGRWRPEVLAERVVRAYLEVEK